jgi:hypothetical protein
MTIAKQFPASIPYVIIMAAAALFVAGETGAREKTADVARGTVSGTVVDAKTGIGVPSSIVKLGKKARIDTTDAAGTFVFDSVPAGTVDISVHAADYDSRSFPNTLVQSGVNIPLTLEIQKSFIDNLPMMLVTAGRIILKKAYQTTSVLRIMRDEVRKAPGAIEDVNRIVQSQPSAVSSADVEDNSYYVRGGSDRENTFLLDGIELNNLSHWGSEYGSGGSITMLNPEFIKSLDYYAGGFPVKYPPRISSVVDITFRDGSTDARKYEIYANVAGFGLFLEGPFAGKNGNYMIDGRVSFLNLMRPFLGVSGIPQYQDGQVRCAYNLGEKSQLICNILGGSEYYTEKTHISQDQWWNKTEAGSHAIGGLTLRSHSDALANEAVFSAVYQSYGEDGTNDSSVVWTGTDNKRERFQLQDNLTLFIRENDQLSLGAVAEREEYHDRNSRDWQYLIADLRSGGDSNYAFTGTMPDTTQPVAPTLLRIDTMMHNDTTAVGYRIGGHLGYTARLKAVTANIGARSDFFTLIHKTGISPRAGLSIDLGSFGEVAASGGMEYQYPSYAEVYLIVGRNNPIELQRSYDAVLSYQKQIAGSVVAGVEAYDKYGDREPLYAIVDTGREMLTDFKRYGNKKTSGLELSVQKKRHDRFYYQLGYTFFNSSTQYADGSWHESDLDLRNAGIVLIGSNLNRYNSVSLSIDLAEGAPYTPIDAAKSSARFRTMYDLSKGWNGARRPPRCEIDIRYDLMLYMKRFNVTGYIEVQNILDRRDIISEEYRTGTKYNQGYIYQTKSRGIFPVVGVTVDF